MLSTVVPLQEFKVIPKAYPKEEWEILEKEDEVLDKVSDDVEEEDNNYEEIRYTDAPSAGKLKKNKKTTPKPSIMDTRYPDRPNLVLLTLPMEFMSGEREKLLSMVDTKFGHLIDSNILKKVANGDMESVPNIWNFLSNYDVKGAFTALLAQQCKFSDRYRISNTCVGTNN